MIFWVLEMVISVIFQDYIMGEKLNVYKEIPKLPMEFFFLTYKIFQNLH